MKAITTTEELLALRNAAGVIKLDDDLKIECRVPFAAGKEIAGIQVNNLDCRGYLNCSGDLDCSGNLNCRGDLYCSGEYLIIRNDFFWSQAHIPAMPEKRYIKRVLPPERQRDHWQARLGVELHGCYEEICRKVLKQIINLLKDEKWSSTERWMLETLRDSAKPVPDWVDEISAVKAGAA